MRPAPGKPAPRRYAPRRWFKTTEIAAIRQWAEDGKSQSYAARTLDRDPGTIAQAAKRYDIQFNAPVGMPRRLTDEQRRARRAHQCRLYRQRRGARPRVFKRRELPVTRFDDPRVMVT